MAEDPREVRRQRLPVMDDAYQEDLLNDADQRQRDLEGQILIKGTDAPFEVFRQGRLAFYLGGNRFNTPLRDRDFFRHDIRTQSGMHTHQGGLVIFVVDGDGYTTVNKKPLNWKKYDLVLLPILPEEVAHQHFNRDPSNPAIWCAFIFHGMLRETGYNITQNERSPDFQK